MSRGAASLLIARVVSALTTLVVLGVVARSRGDQELGEVALGLTVGLALAVLPEAGMTALFIREIARVPGRTGVQLGAMLAIRAVLLPIVTLIAWLLVGAAYPGRETTILLVAIGPAIQQVGELARAVLIARGRVLLAGVHSIIENVAWALAIAAGLARVAGLDPAFEAAATALILVDLAAFAVVAAVLGVRPAWPGRRELTSLLSQAGPFAAFSTLAVVVARIDTLLVSLLLPNGLAAAGAYYAAVRLVAAGEYLPDAVGRAIYPDLSRRFVDDPTAIRGLLAPAARDLLGLAIAAPFGLALVGGWLMTTLYGPSLAGFGWLVVALGVVLPFRYLAMLFGVVLTSADAQGRRTLALGVAVVAVLTIDVPLIPRFGIVAAVAGMLVAWMLVASINVREVNRRFGSVLAPADVVRALLAGSIGLAAGLAILAAGLPASEPLAGLVFALVVGAGLFGRNLASPIGAWIRGVER